jgi:hypothetical protein
MVSLDDGSISRSISRLRREFTTVDNGRQLCGVANGP